MTAGTAESVMARPDRTLVLHDYYGIRGGGERLTLTMAEALCATLMFGYRTVESYEAEMFPAAVQDLHLPVGLRRSGIRPLALAVRFGMERKRVAAYRNRIFSGIAAPFAAPERGENGRNIYYCHTPPRFLYDQRDRFADRLDRLQYRLPVQLFKKGYEASVARMDLLIANSETVRDRIGRFFHRDSVVVFPPCDVDRFSWSEPQGYYLSMARLTPLKRVDTIIDAFRAMPNRRLIVASGGEEEAALRRRAADAPNIAIEGWVGETRLRQLVSTAIATIYVPVDEDFGMSPVESMAAGKPVIGVAEGGLRETVVHGQTGLLLPPDFEAATIVDAVNDLTSARAASMRSACESRAQLFSTARFINSMRTIIAN